MPPEEQEPLLYGWKAIHRWFKDRGVPVTLRTLRDRWAKRPGFPVYKSDLARSVVTEPARLEEWVREHLLPDDSA